MTDAASRAVRPLPPFAAATRGDSWVTTLVDASLIVLGRPSLWAVALVGFLIRGGLVLLALPILVLPSPIQLAASFGLDAVSISGEPTTRFIQEVAAALVGLVAWLVISGVVGALVEIQLTRAVAGEDEAAVSASGADAGAVAMAAAPGAIASSSARLVWGLLLLRLMTLVPVLAALAWGVGRVIDVGYREVTVPSDTATPLVLRIAEGAADAVVVIVVAWLVMELVLAVAARHVLLSRGPGSGLRAARRLFRRPLSALVAFVVGTAVSVAVLAAGLLATQVAWDRVQFELRAGSAIGVLLVLVLMILAWAATLVAAAFLSAWRSALMTGAYLWTVEAGDRRGS